MFSAKRESIAAIARDRAAPTGRLFPPPSMPTLADPPDPKHVPMELNLSKRQERVLWATVRHYISTAEPVGSKVLVEEYQLDASPATVRNAMGRLEKAGLLYQPHTSAGRVPSDSGYRVYVDRYATPPRRRAREAERLLADRCDPSQDHLELLLRGAAQILAGLSGCIALVTMPQGQQMRVRHLRLLALEADRVVVVVVTDSLETHSVTVTVPTLPGEPLPDGETFERELALLSNFLNYHLRDRAIGDLSTLDWQELGREFNRYGDLLRQALGALARRTQPAPMASILIGGVSEVLRQPEFAELRQVKTLVQLLEEEQEQLGALIFERSPALGSDGTSSPPGPRPRTVTVRIGTENPWEPIQGYSLISSPYGAAEAPVGSVGLLGPTRMDYDNAIAVVEATAGYLSETVR